METILDKRARAGIAGGESRRQKRDLSVTVPLSRFDRTLEPNPLATSIQANIRPVERLTPEQEIAWRRFWETLFGKVEGSV